MRNGSRSIAKGLSLASRTMRQPMKIGCSCISVLISSLYKDVRRQFYTPIY